MTDFEIGDEDYVEEINTSYDQDQPIGDEPQALNTELSNSEPIDAKTGQDFLDIDVGEESYGMSPEMLTDTELIEFRNKLKGGFQNISYLNNIESEIRERGLEKFKSRDQQQWYYATDQDFLDDEPHEARKVVGESLNKDGTGVKKATRGVDPKNTPAKTLSFVYISKSDCEICKQYDGKTFAVDSPNRPIIPRLESQGKNGTRPYTHPNCKCKWVRPFSKNDMKNFDQLNESKAEEIKPETVKGARDWAIGKGINFDGMTKTQQYITMIQWMKSNEVEATEDLIDPMPIASMLKIGADAVYPVLKNRFKRIGEAFLEQEHPRDADGKFTKGAGGEKNNQTIVNKLAETYPTMQPEFIQSQLEKAYQVRNKAVKAHNKMKRELNRIPNVEISGRIKDAESMVGKIGRKPDEYNDVDDLYDVSGLRCMAKDLNGVTDSINFIKEHYNVIQEKDNIDEDRDGYRSYHAIVEENGQKHEIQIRTKNQDVWANWAHDNFYKPKNRELREFLKVNKDIINNYSSAMSQYFYELDMGLNPPKPQCPPVIEKVGCLE